MLAAAPPRTACFTSTVNFIDEHEGCTHADPQSASSSTVVPDAVCSACTAATRALLELGADGLAARLAAVDAVADDDEAGNAVRVAQRIELGRLIAQVSLYDAQIAVLSAEHADAGLSEETSAKGVNHIAALRAARISPVPVSVPTRRTLHTHRRAVDEHIAAPVLQWPRSFKRRRPPLNVSAVRKRRNYWL